MSIDCATESPDLAHFAWLGNASSSIFACASLGSSNRIPIRDPLQSGPKGHCFPAAAEAQPGLFRNRDEHAAFCTESPCGRVFYSHSPLQLLSNGANSDKKTTACLGVVWIQPTAVTSNGV
jgi:hypothetical protein